PDRLGARAHDLRRRPRAVVVPRYRPQHRRRPRVAHVPRVLPELGAELARRRADRVRAEPARVLLVAVRDRGRVLPCADAPGPERALGRRGAGGGRRDGHRRRQVPLRAHARRRRLRRRGRRHVLACDHADVERRRLARAGRGLDCDRARYLRVLARRALPRRRVLLRCDAGAAAGAASAQHQPRPDGALVELAAVRRDRRRPRARVLAWQRPPARRAGRARHALRAGGGVVTVELRGITKRFPGVVANDGVDFEAAAGEVHALLGENGAGKSTLSHILSGLYRPEEGEIYLNGAPVTFQSPRDAIDAGVCMVHQHFRLVERFTVAENLILGDRRGAGRSFRLRPGAVVDQVRRLGERYRLPVDPRARIWQLSVGERQRVEILKALYEEARVLILDEPTAVLTPDESSTLFETLREIVAEGRTVIL